MGHSLPKHQSCLYLKANNLKVWSLGPFSRVASSSEVTNSSQPLLFCFPFCFFLFQGKRKWTLIDQFTLWRHKFSSDSRREEDIETEGWRHISPTSPGSQSSRAEGTSGGHQTQRPAQAGTPAYSRLPKRLWKISKVGNSTTSEQPTEWTRASWRSDGASLCSSLCPWCFTIFFEVQAYISGDLDWPYSVRASKWGSGWILTSSISGTVLKNVKINPDKNITSSWLHIYHEADLLSYSYSVPFLKKWDRSPL